MSVFEKIKELKKMEIKNIQKTVLIMMDIYYSMKSICNNLYILYKPYSKQSWPIYEANRLNKRTNSMVKVYMIIYLLVQEGLVVKHA